MTTSLESVRTHDPLAADLTPAGPRIQLDEWNRNIPPRRPIVPHIRIGKRWINVMWALPIAGAALIVLIAVAQDLRGIPAVEAFLQRYPGVPQAQPAVVGFPGWLRVQHFLNMFFMYFIMRAGIQILADHPRLYWNRDCTPGTEWLRFSHPVPAYRMWTAKDDAVSLPGWLGIPGLRHSIGLARWWHFSVNMLWTINGVIFCVLLFLTDQWQRLVPLTWEVFPNALSTAIKYASLNFPPPEPASRFNSLQQLTYFFTFFIAAPIQIAMGLLQGPAFSNRLGWLGRGAEPPGRPVDPLSGPLLVRNLHHHSRHLRVHRWVQAEHQSHVCRCGEPRLGRLTVLPPCVRRDSRSVALGHALHHQARPPRAEDWPVSDRRA